MTRVRRVVIAMIMLCVTGCAGNVKPDVAAARGGNVALTTATALQHGITNLTDAKVLPVEQAQRLTGYSEIIYQKSGPLGDALRAYHAATTLDVRKLKAAEIQTLINDINAPLGKMLNEALPPGALTELTKLIGNVMGTVANVQTEVAKILGGQ